ncbi:integrase core domain-containing protein [Pseudomonas sp. GX19020]|uniref:integrase core domain-containing protein n=1 Tax=Pseudomonas sp. GX19020 TaxID=2942277 RepID=UPI0020191ED9|nr:integrase core domain-containing protein [Pseudomonas sp. GX19020]MCL4065618.1 integrase core domain-containing protein [Pseudomonas sp. GX19020]
MGQLLFRVILVLLDKDGTRFSALGRVAKEFLLRSDNGLVFTSRKLTALVRSYSLKQEFITPPSPACSNRWRFRWLDPHPNGMVERVIRTPKEQYLHRQRFDSIEPARRDISGWISFCNSRRPYQALTMRKPTEAFRLAA